MLNTERPILALALLAAGLAAQNVTLPDNHYLSENPTQNGNSGSGLWWRAATGGRFQLLYEASHFTNHGVIGPVLITKIKFRGEDGEINLGGQVFNGVTIEVGSTTLPPTGLTTAFATNRAPVAPNTTTMGLLGTTSVTVAPSAGTVPNNWNIELDLLAMGNAFLFDPTSAEPNLLIDINIPGAATNNLPPLAMIAMNNTTASGAGIRGIGCTTATPGGATGTLNTTPLVVGVEFAGTGGYANVVPAKNEFYGGACGGQAVSFYQGFLNGQAFDLGAGLTLTPDNTTAPNFYTVTSGAPAPDTTQVNVAADVTADDGVALRSLGFTFNYPTGSTTQIVASSNGYVWLDPAMTDSGFAAVAARLLGDPVATTSVPPYSGARLAILWKDLNMLRNVGLNTAAGLHVKTVGSLGSQVCYVTWWNVGEFNVVSGTGIQGHTNWTFQIAIHEATGVVEYRYGNVPAFATASTTTVNCYATMVGFSPGRIGGATGQNARDPQNRDLSLETPFTTNIEGASGNLGLTAAATPYAGGLQYGGRLYAGQSVTWNVSNVPLGTILGAQLLDIAASRPGFQFPTITAPGCMLSTSNGATLWEIHVLPGPSIVGAVPFVVPAGLLGVDLYAQWIALDGLFGGPNLISASSNAIKHTVGLN
jgi:hypothetical protein